MKKNLNNIIKYCISIMFILLPIIDMLRTTFIKDIEIFNFSIIEIVNITLIGVPFLITIIRERTQTKYKKGIYMYILLLVIYISLHCLNITKFDKNIYQLANQNAIIEIYYILRIYFLPIALMYVLFKNKEIFTKRYYLNILKILIIIISGSIVVQNIFRFSYSSYNIGKGPYEINKTNFFDIFKYKENYKELLTVGFFPSANQLSIILCMLLPFTILNFYLKQNVKNWLLIILQCVSMIIVGTKSSSLGSIIILVGTFLIYLLFILIKKEKTNKVYLISNIISIITISLFLYISPFKHSLEAGYNYNYNKNITEENMNYAYKKIDENLTIPELKEILNNYSGVFKISNQFYEMYPIESDPEFWISIAKRDRKINNDYRIIKNDIIKRIIYKNNNKYDKYFGVGYTLNFQDIERDYVFQYYIFGIIGSVLLIGVYIVIYILNVISLFKKDNFNYLNCVLLVSSFFGLTLCYFSGHLFGWMSPMIILSTSIIIGRKENLYEKS